VKSHIKIKDFDAPELAKAESRLREQGYRLVRRKSENDLLPGQYIKQDFAMAINSSGGGRRWTLRWRSS